MRDEPLRASLADAARHEAVRRYSHETQCRTLELLLEELTAEVF
jgi:hypothetical protein